MSTGAPAAFPPSPLGEGPGGEAVFFYFVYLHTNPFFDTCSYGQSRDGYGYSERAS
jgi:hypothetical protein